MRKADFRPSLNYMNCPETDLTVCVDDYGNGICSSLS